MDGEAGWWTTSGNIGLPPLARAMGVGRQQRVMNNFVSTIAIEKKLDSLYELEHFDDELHTSPEDDQVMKLWNQRGKVTDGHIELPIPWKNDARTLPDNKYIAESRLRSLLKSLREIYLIVMMLK